MNEYRMPFLRFKIRRYTDCWVFRNSFRLDVTSNDRVLDIDYGVWNFRYFRKDPNKEWH